MGIFPVPENREPRAEHADVEDERGTKMRGESVLRYARDRVGFLQ
jgi:hypothetical protein